MAVFAIVFAVGTMRLNSEKVQVQTQNAKINTDNLVTLNMEFPGVTCQGCSDSIRTSLESIPGVYSVNVDAQTKRGKIQYDPNLVGEDTILNNEIVVYYQGKKL